jgi:hypothetical protein
MFFFYLILFDFLINLLKKNSLVCKSAIHDGRVAPWNGENSPVLIRNNSFQSSIFPSVLRNGILSTKFVFYLNFIFINYSVKDQHHHYIILIHLEIVESMVC